MPERRVSLLSLYHTGVRRVCWRPPCPDSTARSPSYTRTSSCRGSRLRQRPLPLLLRPLHSTSTSPPPPLLPPHPPTPPPTASLTSWRSTRPRRTHQTPTLLCPSTPTRHRRPSTPTPTRYHSGHGSSYVLHFPYLEGTVPFQWLTLKEHARESVAGSYRDAWSHNPCFLPTEGWKYNASEWRKSVEMDIQPV